MSTPGTPADRCYRHPDRQSYILCQRCGRTICPECQTPAPVGFQCPECMRESRASAPRVRPAILTNIRRAGRSGAPVVTYSLIGVNVAVFVLQLLGGLIGFGLTNLLAYFPVLTALEPWRLITSVFAHSPNSIFHIGFNMLSLFIFGRILEPAIGRWRFLALYLLSGLGGSVAVLLLEPLGGVLGASGAIFGLMGGLLVIQRGLGGNATGLLVIIGINLVIGFLPGSAVSWQAHLGGVLVGAAVGFVYLRTRSPRQRNLQVGLLTGVLALLIVVTVVAFTVLASA